MLTVIIFILVLTVLVLIHELGHFFVAKKFGIKVEEFGFGLPPRLIGKKIGETIYSINWLPIGGFVKLYGEDEAGAGKLKVKSSKFKASDKDRAFFARPWWQKFLVVFAGVFMNFVLSVVILSFLFAVVGATTPGKDVVIGQVVKASPAETAGIKKGDVISFVENVRITDTAQLVSETKKHLGKEITLVIKSDSKTKNVKVTPRSDSPKGEGPLGVSISQNFETKKYPWYLAPIEGVKEAFKISVLIITGLGMLVYQLVTTGAVPRDVAGPVGIAQLTGQIVQVGPFALLSFISLLSLNLAVLNVLPIPALDGGRLFFILIEAVTRRKVNPRFESITHAVGMALLLALIALITFHDISRLISGQSIFPQ